MDFKKFEIKYFNDFNYFIQKIVRDYYYLYRYQINHNFGTNNIYIILMLKAIKAKQNNHKILNKLNK